MDTARSGSDGRDDRTLTPKVVGEQRETDDRDQECR
jgi:hypothetical protein